MTFISSLIKKIFLLNQSLNQIQFDYFSLQFDISKLNYENSFNHAIVSFRMNSQDLRVHSPKDNKIHIQVI